MASKKKTQAKRPHYESNSDHKGTYVEECADSDQFG